MSELKTEPVQDKIDDKMDEKDEIISQNKIIKYESKNLYMKFMNLCCDSVEWCIKKDFEHIMAVGHYQLNDNKKMGGISLFDTTKLDTKIGIQFTKTKAILDMKWYNYNKKTYLLNACVDGLLQIHSMNDKIQLKNIGNHEFKSSNDNDTLPICLSLDYNINGDIVTSLSNGYIGILNVDNNYKFKVKHYIKGHSEQVWSCCYDRFNPNIVYSCSDYVMNKSLFNIYDLRQNNNDSIIYQDKCNIHSLGVCNVICNSLNDNQFMTGCYDEYLRLFDKRMLNNNDNICNVNSIKLLDKLKFNDGVWRIKISEYKHDNNVILLIGCMRDHFNIVSIDNNDKLSILTQYNKHEMNCYNKLTKFDKDLGVLAYGCDFSKKCIKNNQIPLIGSCSFYDKQLHLWKINKQTNLKSCIL